MKQTPMPRRSKPLRQRSKKMAALYRNERAPLVAVLLAARPWCEVRWDENCQGRAVDVDEIKGRGAGGSIIDPANCQTACRYCHDMKGTHPTEAHGRGFTRWSHEEAGTDPDDLLLPCPRCGGQGEVLTAGDTNRDYSTGPCPDCGGSGEGLWLPGDPRRNDEEVA